MNPPPAPTPGSAEDFVDRNQNLDANDAAAMQTARAELQDKDINYMERAAAEIISKSYQQKEALKTVVKERATTVTQERLRELEAQSTNANLDTLEERITAIETEAGKIFELFPDLKPEKPTLGERAVNRIRSIATAALGPLAASGTFMSEIVQNFLSNMNNNSFMNTAKQWFWQAMEGMNIPFLRGASEKAQMYAAVGTVGAIVKEESEATSQNKITFDYRANQGAYRKIIRKEQERRQAALPADQQGNRVQLTPEEVEELFATITYDYIDKQRKADAANGTESKPIAVSLAVLENPDAANDAARAEAMTTLANNPADNISEITVGPALSATKDGANWKLTVLAGDIDLATKALTPGSSSADLVETVKNLDPSISKLTMNAASTMVMRNGGNLEVSLAANNPPQMADVVGAATTISSADKILFGASTTEVINNGSSMEVNLAANPPTNAELQTLTDLTETKGGNFIKRLEVNDSANRVSAKNVVYDSGTTKITLAKNMIPNMNDAAKFQSLVDAVTNNGNQTAFQFDSGTSVWKV